MTRRDDLITLANVITSAIEQARYLKLPTSAYVLSMALIEVMQERDAIEARHKGDTTR